MQNERTKENHDNMTNILSVHLLIPLKLKINELKYKGIKCIALLRISTIILCYILYHTIK